VASKAKSTGKEIMMLGYVGQGLLGFALLMAGLQAFGSTRYFPARNVAYGQFLFVALAFCLLIYAHVTDQFSLISVVFHSHTQKPLLYKIAGAWGNHEGSMLLWVLILSGYSAYATRQVSVLGAPYTYATHLLGFMNFGFLLFVLMACDPFAIANPIPMEGQDLNPLLQDPSLAIHPPILYMGYAGFSIPFIYAIVTLIHGEIPESWATIIRPWILFAWSFLTLGVGLGSFWAYYELGWGGWWFWDPVENAALMPFLVATALLHTVIVVKSTKSLSAWTIFLCILTFALCLFGTFLVRSGLLTSVHNFAVDPERGAFIFILSSLLVLPSIGLFIWRFKKIHSLSPTILWSRSGLIVVMSLLLLVGTITVGIGTLYPLLMEFIGQKITVGAPYFISTFVPMMIPFMVLVGLGPWYSWPASGLTPSSLRWLVPLLSLTIISVLVAYLGYGVRHIIGLFALMGAIWTIFATAGLAIKKRKILSGTIVGHLGMGITVLGMVISSLGEQEILTALKVGESVSIGPIRLTLQAVTSHEKSNYNAHRAQLQTDDGKILKPEKRFYWTQGVIHGESAIRSVGFAHLNHIYVTIGEEYENQKWSIHAYYKPFINVLWVGLLIMVLGGFVAFAKRFNAMKKILPLLFITIHPIWGVDAHEQLLDTQLEQRARQISQQIICPTCHGQTLDESPVESAIQLRMEIRKWLKEGDSDQDIFNRLINHYGTQIITTPPMNGHTYVLWFGPWVLLGLSFFFLIFRKYAHPS
jgi:cytochrome c-type biogenesis protein CcmF